MAWDEIGDATELMNIDAEATQGWINRGTTSTFALVAVGGKSKLYALDSEHPGSRISRARWIYRASTTAMHQDSLAWATNWITAINGPNYVGRRMCVRAKERIATGESTRTLSGKPRAGGKARRRTPRGVLDQDDLHVGDPEGKTQDWLRD
jgi:hypothetical protein